MAFVAHFNASLYMKKKRILISNISNSILRNGSGKYALDTKSELHTMSVARNG